MAGIIGRKIGMTRVFDDANRAITVTVIEAGPCAVTQVKNAEKDGYSAVQLSFEDKKGKNTPKPEKGHFDKAGVTPKMVVKEFRTSSAPEQKPGDEVRVDTFAEGETVKLTGWAKGKGFQGVMKRHGFSGGPMSHGQSDRLRAPGSVGQSSYPSRVFKGMKMGGRTGNQRVTLNRRRIIKVIPERNILMVAGAVPGGINSLVLVRKS